MAYKNNNPHSFSGGVTHNGRGKGSFEGKGITNTLRCWKCNSSEIGITMEKELICRRCGAINNKRFPKTQTTL